MLKMFGSLFYICENQVKLENTICTLNFENVGAGKEWLLKKSLKHKNRFNRSLYLAMKEVGLEFKEIDFYGGCGNDERIFSWPTINMTDIGLQRFPFNEYHTSDDTPEIINPELLIETLKTCLEFCNILEHDFIPHFTGKVQP